MRGGNVRKTSDDFFQDNQDTFDVIFIDGLHTYEQVRRDVVNAIRTVRPGGWVAMHDMLPRSWTEHHTPVVSQRAWTGDVWKVGFELAASAGIDFKILKIDHGVGVYRVTEPAAALADRQAELKDQGFGFLYEHIGELPLAEWQDAQAWLRS